MYYHAYMHHRYLARAVLIPFVYEAPPIRVDTLDSMLSNAHRALPEVVSIGNWLKHLPESKLYDMVDKIKEALGGRMDERLTLQYALYTLCAKKVRMVVCMCWCSYTMIVHTA